MKNRSGRLSLALLPFLTLYLVFSASAQDLDTVTIAGRITDSNGLAIVGASVAAASRRNGCGTNGRQRR